MADPDRDEAPDRDESDKSDDSEEMRELLQKVAAAPSIDPSTLSRPPAQTFQGFQPGERLGHFRILDRVGAGGMGVVYRAEDERLRRQVALKVLPPHQFYDRERRKRLWREAQSAAAVNHANIASIYELGEDEAGVMFIAMEFLDGAPLRRRLAEGLLPLSEVLGIAVQVAQGLARAHEAGIVHRDLKPDNVMVLGDRTVKVLDFGLAKLLAAPDERVPATGPDSGTGSTATKDGQVVGTPRYMSPEQKTTAQVDARTDLYSFGVVLTEMLIGHWPEEGERGLGAVHRAAVASRGPLELRERVLLERLMSVAARCLEVRPEARYSDGRELLAALRSVDADTLPAGSRGPARRAWPWLGVSIAAAAVALAVGAAVIVASRLGHERAPIQEPLGSGGAPGVSERRLTANPPDNPVIDAALSPDGKALAYVDRTGLFLRTLDPPSTEQLPLDAPGPLESASWMPDGQELVVASSAADRLGEQVFRVRRDGTAVRVAAGPFERPRVSPDGKRLAWMEPKGIAVGPVDAPREKGRVIVLASPGDAFDEVSWSPSGERIGYVRLTRSPAGTTARIETAPSAGGAPVQVLEERRLVQEVGGAAMTWAPDGRIVFALAEPPSREVGFTLWAVGVDVASGEPRERPRQLHAWTGSTPSLLTSGAGGALAYSRTESQSDVYVGELADGGRRLLHPKRLTPTDRNEWPSSWSPDSKAVLYTSDQDGRDELFAGELSTWGVRRLFATRGASAQTWPAFGPGGKQLLFWQHAVSPDGAPHHAELWRSGPDGSSPERILAAKQICEHGGGGVPPRGARVRCGDRGECLLGEIDGSSLAFRWIDPVRGDARDALTAANPGSADIGWALSPDGARLALPGSSGQVELLELKSGRATTRIVEAGCALEHAAFGRDGGLFITGVCAGDRPYKLFFVEPNRSPHVLWDSSSTWFGLPSVSPDGKHLAFAVRPFDNDIWLASGL